MSTSLQRAALALFTATGVAIAVWALRPQSVPVDTAAVEAGLLEVTIEGEGVTRVRDIYAVSAPISGKMLRSSLKAGDPVVKDVTVVAVLQPTEPQFLDIRSQRINQAAVDAAEAAVKLAEAAVSHAKSQLTFTQADLRRATELAARRAIAERALDKAALDHATAEAALASAAATLEVRRRELESARAHLIQPGQAGSGGAACCIQVLAPVSGRLLRILAESEQVVPAGAPLLELGDPRDLEIVIDLLSRDAVRIEVGAAAVIENWGGEALAARVRRVEPAAFTKVSALGIEEQRVKAILDFGDSFPRVTNLGHAFRVVARITVSKTHDAPLIPLSALFRLSDSWAVFKVVDGRAAQKRIAIGQRNHRYAEIVDGLALGERVILHPSDRIHDGVRVAQR